MRRFAGRPPKLQAEQVAGDSQRENELRQVTEGGGREIEGRHSSRRLSKNIGRIANM